MTWNVTRRDRCRICRATDLHGFLHLPEMPLPEGHLPAERADEAFRADVTVYWCPQCGGVQTLQDVDLSDYYARYGYTVSRSPFVRRFMERFAREVWNRFSLQPDDAVVEIGSGDGYQLKCFKDLGAKVLGFEPAGPLAAVARRRGVKTVESLFSAETVGRIPQSLRPLHAVVAQYTFDHLPEPVPFLRAVESMLDPERGVVVLEVHDFEQIFERSEACLFTHEHTIYLTVESMARTMEQAGLRLASVDIVPQPMRRGNSLIAAGVPSGSPIPSDPPPPSPHREALRQEGTYDRFARRVRHSHDRLAEHVRNMRACGRRVAGYGAAGRGVDTLAIAGLTADDIECVYDIDTKLHGLAMPGSGVPVKPPQTLLTDPVDEVIVFSYGYMSEIRQDLEPYLRQGGCLTSVLEYLQAGAMA